MRDLFKAIFVVGYVLIRTPVLWYKRKEDERLARFNQPFDSKKDWC